MRRIIPISIALALAGTTLVAGSASTSVASEAAAAAAAKKVRTPFALGAVAIGTRVMGGALPVDSTQTGAQSMACTNKAGINKRNHVAKVDLGAFGVARGVSSRTWTEKKGGTVSSYAEHSVARVNIFETPLGSLDINGLSSLSRAYHDAKGYHAQTSSKVASITFTPKGGKPIGLTIPTIGRPLEIPGLAKITIGNSNKKVKSTGALAIASALEIRLLLTNTKVIVAQTKASIGEGIKSGIFYGNATAIRASVLGPLVGVGAQPIAVMPCQGSKGKPITQEVAGVNIPGLLKVSGLFAGVQGAQNGKKAVAIEAAHVASVDIGNGALVINGIRAVAQVTRNKGKITRSSKGTNVLEILVDGKPTDIPLEDIRIEGLLELDGNIVENTLNGMKVVALRITLLNGTGAVIDLGSVTVGIKGAGKNRR